MKIVIDFVLIFIVAACTWNGFKRGLIGGIAWMVLASILSLIISSANGDIQETIDILMKNS